MDEYSSIISPEPAGHKKTKRKGIHMGFYEDAQKRIKEELPAVKGSKEGAIKHAVMDALLNFARQDEEFAQAIVQGGSFAACMAAVCKGIGSSISDLEAYRRAAAFYFPGADVRFEMRIDLVGAAAGKDAEEEGPKTETPKGLVIDLADFL